MSDRIVRGRLPAIAVVAAIAASASIVTTSTASMAADLGPYGSRQQWRPPAGAGYYPQAYRWSGFYAGLQGGYGWGDTNATSSFIGVGGTEAFNYSKSGGLLGAHLGYNYQVNNFVFGVETDLETSWLGGSGFGGFGGKHTTNVDYMGSLRGRFGIAAGNTLFYLTGGLAYAGLDQERSSGAMFVPFAGNESFKTGWTLGGGIEHAFTSNISARIEYRYTDLGRNDWTHPTSGLVDSSDVSFSAVRAGLSFRF
jgi:outer membrane immunogenic protein